MDQVQREDQQREHEISGKNRNRANCLQRGNVRLITFEQLTVNRVSS